MIKRLLISICLSLSIISYLVDAETPQDPFSIDLFNLPEQFPYTNYRQEWFRLSGFELSGLHWNQFIVIYTNKSPLIYRNNYLAYVSMYEEEEDEDDDEAIPSFQQYPVGTIFLKEHYAPDSGKPGIPTFVSLMIKQSPGYHPKGGDWEYVHMTAAGKVLLQGKSNDAAVFQQCANCHNNMQERDYIFSTHYSE